MKRFLIALLLGVGTPTMAVAEPDRPSDLQQFLAKRFKQGWGVFGVIASVIPGKLDPESIAGMEGRKADGSYWTSVFFNGSNIRMFDDPRNALAKFCASSGRTLKAVQPYALAPKQGLAFFSTKLADGNGPFLVPEDMPGRWVMSPPDGHFSVQRETYSGNSSAMAAGIDARGALGVFSCLDVQGAPAWHVAILPTTAGDWRQIGDWQLSTGNRAVMLSVREVDRALVARVEATVDRRRQGEKSVADAKALKDAVRRTDGEARAAKALPALQTFQAAVKIGDETSCGLVLGVRGPLVEVQVPAAVNLENGATRLFVKRTMLAPVHGPVECYSYSPFERISRLNEAPTEQLAR